MWPDLENALQVGAVIAYGATPGWAAWLAAQLVEGDPLVVVVTPDDASARDLETDVRFFIGGERDATELDPIASLPGIDVSPYAELSPDRSCIVERVATLYRLAQPALRPRVVVTSAEALVRRTVTPAALAERGLTIAKGTT